MRPPSALTREFERKSVQRLLRLDPECVRQGRGDIHGAGGVHPMLTLPRSPEDDRDPAVVVIGAPMLCRIFVRRPTPQDHRLKCEQNLAGPPWGGTEFQP